MSSTYPDPKATLIKAIEDWGGVKDPEGLAQHIISNLNGNDILLSVQYERIWKREAEAEKAARATAATTMPEYHGAITRCQAQATDNSNSRWPISNRCSKKATKVRRIKENHGSYTGDGRVAVCGIHAKAQYTARWVNNGHWTDKGKPATADEIVEPEYQP